MEKKKKNRKKTNKKNKKGNNNDQYQVRHKVGSDLQECLGDESHNIETDFKESIDDDLTRKEPLNVCDTSLDISRENNCNNGEIVMGKLMSDNDKGSSGSQISSEDSGALPENLEEREKDVNIGSLDGETDFKEGIDDDLTKKEPFHVCDTSSDMRLEKNRENCGYLVDLVSGDDEEDKEFKNRNNSKFKNIEKNLNSSSSSESCGGKNDDMQIVDTNGKCLESFINKESIVSREEGYITKLINDKLDKAASGSRIWGVLTDLESSDDDDATEIMSKCLDVMEEDIQKPTYGDLMEVVTNVCAITPACPSIELTTKSNQSIVYESKIDPIQDYGKKTGLNDLTTEDNTLVSGTYTFKVYDLVEDDSDSDDEQDNGTRPKPLRVEDAKTASKGEKRSIDDDFFPTISHAFGELESGDEKPFVKWGQLSDVDSSDSENEFLDETIQQALAVDNIVVIDCDVVKGDKNEIDIDSVSPRICDKIETLYGEIEEKSDDSSDDDTILPYLSKSHDISDIKPVGVRITEESSATDDLGHDASLGTKNFYQNNAQRNASIIGLDTCNVSSNDVLETERLPSCAKKDPLEKRMLVAKEVKQETAVGVWTPRCRMLDGSESDSSEADCS